MAKPEQAPHDDEAERAVLGCMLLDPDRIIPIVLGLMDQIHLYRDKHRTIFAALRSMHRDREMIDLLTIKANLERGGVLGDAGGPAYLASLVDDIPSSGRIEHYIAVVVERATARDLWRAAHEIIRDCMESGDQAEKLVDRAQASIFAIAQRRRESKRLSPIKHALLEAVETIERAEEHRKAGRLGSIGLKFGLMDLDYKTGGMDPADSILIAARTSIGKTALAVHVMGAAAEAGKRVAFYSLEMERKRLALRSMTSLAGVDSSRIRSALLTPLDMEALEGAAERMATWPVWIDDSPALSVAAMLSQARKLKAAEGGLDLVIVDYLQLAKGPATEKRHEEVAAVSRELKALAKDLAVPVISLAQLNRAVESRSGEKRPVLADLRESGALEMDADTVLLLWAPPATENVLEIVIAKQRNGPTGAVRVRYDRTTQRFDNLAPEGE